MNYLRDITLEENMFIWGETNSFPGHRGRPGQRGGSLPKGSSADSKPSRKRIYRSPDSPKYFENTFNSTSLTLARQNHGTQVVSQLRQAIRKGEEIDAIVCVNLPDGKKTVIDGHHRLCAFMEENKVPMALNFMDKQAAWDYIHTYTNSLNRLLEFWNSYPGHPGRPGQRGGSLPRGAGSAHVMSEKEIISKAWRTSKDSETDPGYRKFALEVAAAQGFTGTPQKMSNDDFQKIDEEKYEILHRGIRDTEEMSAEKIHKEFMDGEYYVSGNLYDTIGKGIYMTDDYDYAKSYADQNKLQGTKGIVESIAIPRNAKVLDLRTSEGLAEASKAFDEVNKLNTKISDEYKTDLFAPSDSNTKQPYTLTVWEYLETKGYDGIRNDAEFCLFNRTIAIVNEQVEK